MYLEMFPIYFYCKAVSNESVGKDPRTLQLINHLLSFSDVPFESLSLQKLFDIECRGNVNSVCICNPILNSFYYKYSF